MHSLFLRSQISGSASTPFSLTSFKDPQTGDKETELGNKMADLAKAAGIKHYIWSTLVNVENESGGKYDVPHATNKVRILFFLQLKYLGKSRRSYHQNWTPSHNGFSWILL